MRPLFTMWIFLLFVIFTLPTVEAAEVVAPENAQETMARPPGWHPDTHNSDGTLAGNWSTDHSIVTAWCDANDDGTPHADFEIMKKVLETNDDKRWHELILGRDTHCYSLPLLEDHGRTTNTYFSIFLSADGPVGTFETPRGRMEILKAKWARRKGDNTPEKILYTWDFVLKDKPNATPISLEEYARLPASLGNGI